MAEIARNDLNRRLAPASGDHGSPRHRIRLPAAGERDPAPALLGRGVRAAEAERAFCTSKTEGKNKGCWVMTATGDRQRSHRRARGRSPHRGDAGPDEDAKVIVRSNGTVGYVGKDIAYHLWKFGLLGRDFGYRKFYQYPNQHESGSPTEQRRARPSAFRRRGGDLQRHRLAPDRSAEHGDRGAARCWATPKRPRTTRIFPTRWSR